MIVRCKTCGNHIRYDIELGRLFCDYCGNSYVPEELPDESPTFDAVTYTCQSCGAQLITADDTEATAFCSFCGSASILTGRLNKIKKPDRILPFTVTKEQCRKIYLKKARNAFLAPAWLKQDSCVDSFRAIYMPYWMYTARAEGKIKKKETYVYQDGDYEVTRSYNYSTGWISETVASWMHDASIAFADDISESIGFDKIRETELQPFHQAFLSGFYADMADTGRITDRNTIQKAAKAKLGAVYNGQFSGTVSLSPKTLVYMPVWFMSARNGDTLTYAAVNGYTGQIVVDFPISTGGFFTVSAILAAVLAVLLNFMLVLRPELAFWFSVILAVFGIHECRKEEKRLNEIAELSGVPKAPFYTVKKRLSTAAAGVIIVFCALTLLFACYSLNQMSILSDKAVFLIPIAFTVAAISLRRALRRDKTAENIYIPKRTLFSILICLLSALLLLTRNNILIYLAILPVAVTFCLNCLAAFTIHQKIATRRPPQFNRKGADDNA